MLSLMLQVGAPAASMPVPAPAPPPRTRCRREAETGSLASVRRICRTTAEWERLYGAGRQQSEALRGPGTAPPGVNGP